MKTHEARSFVLRLPLLPFERFAALGDAFRPDRTTRDMQAMHNCLLGEFLKDQRFREALWLASPTLLERLDREHSGVEISPKTSLVLPLLCYVARACHRSTPFGLFATTSVGRFGRKATLEVGDGSAIVRRTRLDYEVVERLAARLQSDCLESESLRWYPNNSLSRIGDAYRYVERATTASGTTNRASEVANSPALTAALTAAATGATTSDIRRAICRAVPGATERAAREFVERLVAAQLLESDLVPPLTGMDALTRLCENIPDTGISSSQRSLLQEVAHSLNGCDTRSGADNIRTYERVVGAVGDIVPVNPAHAVQVDALRDLPELELPKLVAAEFARGAEILSRIGPYGAAATNGLREFSRGFANRYGEAEIPLLTALDADSGLSFGVGHGAHEQATPSLERLGSIGIGGKGRTDDYPWGRTERFLSRRALDVIRAHAFEMQLSSEDLTRIGNGTTTALPDSFGMCGVLSAASERDVESGNFRLVLRGLFGPGGARFLGRLTGIHSSIDGVVGEILRAEEALRRPAIVAEVVHLPSDREANVVARSALREYEIPYMGRSGLPLKNQISARDLFVSVRDGRLVLRSASLDREIIPALTAAHHYSTPRNLPVYRFLCAMEDQGCTPRLAWNWGPLKYSAPFLPRVTSGRLVLALATWRLFAEEILSEGVYIDCAADNRLKDFAERWQIPRYTLLVRGDNELPIDFENPNCRDILLRNLRKHRNERLIELLPGPAELCTRSSDGGFAHEVWVPFIRKAEAEGDSTHAAKTLRDVRRSLILPGRDCLSLKVYCGPAAIDDVLCRCLGPNIERFAATGAVTRWFFIRYADPEWHLRLRLFGSPERLWSEILPKVTTLLAPMAETHVITRIQTDTYERESVRYGGSAAMDIVEQLFWHDSELALGSLISLCGGGTDLDRRWRLAVHFVDGLLCGCGLDVRERHAVLQERGGVLGRRLEVTAAGKRCLSALFATNRQWLRSTIGAGSLPYEMTDCAADWFQHQQTLVAELAGALSLLRKQGGLDRPLPSVAMSLVHMHVNRMVRSAHRLQEFVVCELLRRAYAEALFGHRQVAL